MDIEEENRGELFSQSARDLLATLEECRETCISGLMHSLDEGGDFAKKEHIRWMIDCSEICRLSVDFFIRDSEYAGDIISLCAFICDDCAESCEKFFNDSHMLACAEICRKCAESCRDMIIEEEAPDGEDSNA